MKGFKLPWPGMLLALCMAIIFLSACSSSSSGNPKIKIITRHGDIIIELFQDKAPVTTNAFLNYVDSNYYYRSTFYRVLKEVNQPSYGNKAELIQGGLYRTNRAFSAALPGIPHETTATTGLRHERGTLSMARNEPGSASTEFFICMADQPGFDFGGMNNADGQGYAAFGIVRSGMEVLEKIYEFRDWEQYFDPPVVIFNIERYSGEPLP